jgi:hypothetical protein
LINNRRSLSQKTLKAGPGPVAATSSADGTWRRSAHLEISRTLQTCVSFNKRWKLSKKKKNYEEPYVKLKFRLALLNEDHSPFSIWKIVSLLMKLLNIILR